MESIQLKWDDDKKLKEIAKYFYPEYDVFFTTHNMMDFHPKSGEYSEYFIIHWFDFVFYTIYPKIFHLDIKFFYKNKKNLVSAIYDEFIKIKQ
jgi:hypothetical protein